MIRNKENAHLFKYNTNKQIREQIDKCLHKINSAHAQCIGSDMTKEDYDKYKESIKPLKEKIKELDSDFYQTVYPYEQ